MPSPSVHVPGPTSVDELEQVLTQPTPEVIESLAGLEGDLMVLGAGGKMGPTLAMLAQRAVTAGGGGKQVIAVSRFTATTVRAKLDRCGVQTVACDLMVEDELASLPKAANIIYMVGVKFGATGQETRTWAVNAYLPGRVVSHFPRARLVLFSSGNVYPFTPVVAGGCTERAPPAPVGEYAQSVLGRERIFEHFCSQSGVLGLVFRLNYAVEMRYGVLLDVARKVWLGEQVDLSMGHVNVVWQGDANAYALRALNLAGSPPTVLNVTGPETVSIRHLATVFGRLLEREPILVGSEQPNALLSNAQLTFRLMGYPRVALGQVIGWVAHWVKIGGPVLGKPTKFQVRDGRF